MLSETAIWAAKPREKTYKLSNERGYICALINPTRSRWWRFKYLRFGKERGLSFGVHPEVSLALARKRRDEARTQLAEGIDVSHKRKAEKLSSANTFRGHRGGVA